MQFLFVQSFLSVRLTFNESKLFTANIKGNFYERVQELDAREKTLTQSLCRVRLPSDAFYHVHPVQAGLLEDPVKLGVLMNAKHHAHPNKLWSMLTPCSLPFQ